MENLQESMVLKRLLKNPDFRMFMKEVSNFYVYEDEIVKKYISGFISGDKLKELNYHIAQRNALGSVLIAQEALEEDLAGLIDELEDKEE